MKELTKTIKQTLFITKEYFWFALPMTLFGGVMGLAIPFIVMALQEDVDGSIHLGALFSFMFAMFVYLIYIIAGTPHDINMAISMGRTRKYLGLAHYLVWVKNMFFTTLISLLIAVLEAALYDKIHPGLACELDMKSFFGNPVVFVLFVVCVPAVMIFIGMLAMRFGNKMIVVVWGIGIFLMLFGNLLGNGRISVAKGFVEGLIELFSRTGVAALFCIVVSALCFAGAQLLLRKQRVTY